jgi:hypothetical protein
MTLDGSDDKKSHLLVQMKSLVVGYGLPLIFLTLNPADNYSPLALFYAGEEIDLNEFDADLYPYKNRVDLLLNNPVAVLLYFHHTIRAILSGPIQMGLFGPLLHYYGTIEYQGRGTPHIHLAIWIKGTGTPSEMREKAKADPDYRARLLKYISSCIVETMPPRSEQTELEDNFQSRSQAAFGSRDWVRQRQDYKEHDPRGP